MKLFVKKHARICVAAAVIVAILVAFAAYKAIRRSNALPVSEYKACHNIAEYWLNMTTHTFAATPYTFTPYGFYTWEQVSLLGDVQYCAIQTSPGHAFVEYIVKDKNDVSYSIACGYLSGDTDRHTGLVHHYGTGINGQTHSVKWNEHDAYISVARLHYLGEPAAATDGSSLLFQLTSDNEAEGNAVFWKIKACLMLGKVISILVALVFAAVPVAAVAVPVILIKKKKKAAAAAPAEEPAD